LGWETSFLGYPATDETQTSDGGKFNHFTHGSIYWKPNIGAHEVHGVIRDHWAQNGWETNSKLGYPISDETPSASGSADRFSDFENGVMFWKSGEQKAIELQKLTLGGASMSVWEVAAQINEFILPLLPEKIDGRPLYISAGPGLCGPDPIGPKDRIGDPQKFIRPVSDYWFHWGGARNRMYKVRTDFGITVEGWADISVTLDLWIEVFYDKAKRTVFASPRYFWPYADPPCGVSEAEIDEKVGKFVRPHLDTIHQMKKVPKGINILSLKVMPNGDLNVYVAP
jgi:hypothetical protein